MRASCLGSSPDACHLSYRKEFYYSVAKGAYFSTVVAKIETDLTVELLTSCVPLVLP